MPRILVLLVVAAALVGCSAESRRGTSDLEQSDSTDACDYLVEIVRDGADGVLTVAEVDDRAEELNRKAASASPEVKAAAERLLTAVTTGTVSEMQTAVASMGDACREAGG